MKLHNLIIFLFVRAGLGSPLSPKTNTINMNGEYLLSNANPSASGKWNSDYGKFKDVEFFDVYSPPISTKYSEVYWTMMDPVPLDEKLGERFAGKTMAIIGYETDQVMKTSDGDVSVPITWAYNHHFEAYLSGSLSEMKKVEGEMALNDHGMNNHGTPSFYHTYKRENVGDPNGDSEVPTSQFFSEGNGGEFRKSYHGYPKGMAQFIESPTTFHIQPMQIDTKNRHYNGTDFKPDLLPKASAAPPNASYSGLLECPCTDRIVKKIEVTYTTETSGSCATAVDNATECFEAAQKVQSSKIDGNETLDSATMPSGCSVVQHKNGSVNAYFNVYKGGVPCGGGEEFEGSFTSDPSQTTVTIHLDNTIEKATITMSGPNGQWFSVGLNTPNFVMKDAPYTIVVDGSGNVSERKLGDHDPGTVIDSTLTVTSNTIKDGVREVVMTRPFKGKTPDHYTFDPKVTNIPLISASGLGPVFAYHGPKLRSGGTIKLSVLDSPTCICNGGIKGSINGIPFHKDCLPEPKGDLVQQKNPTCWVETYQGGLSCCHHGNILLDKDQTPPEELLTYHIKFRFYFQPYTEATATKPASHTNLLRMYYQTEANAGEYDVPKCSPTTPTEDCVHEITAHFQVKDMMRECPLRKDPSCWGNTTGYEGINLIYAAGHCHAPSCISMELYNADTGMLLCSHYPVYGKTHQVFDELGYLAIPPCLWGPETEGLAPPTFMPFNGNLTSIKRNNNTYTHYGEMASWQMRGILANPAE